MKESEKKDQQDQDSKEEKMDGRDPKEEDSKESETKDKQDQDSKGKKKDVQEPKEDGQVPKEEDYKEKKKECQVNSAKTPGAGLQKESGKVPSLIFETYSFGHTKLNLRFSKLFIPIEFD